MAVSTASTVLSGPVLAAQYHAGHKALRDRVRELNEGTIAADASDAGTAGGGRQRHICVVQHDNKALTLFASEQKQGMAFTSTIDSCTTLVAAFVFTRGDQLSVRNAISRGHLDLQNLFNMINGAPVFQIVGMQHLSDWCVVASTKVNKSSSHSDNIIWLRMIKQYLAAMDNELCLPTEV
jgi:hypothetical protein